MAFVIFQSFSYCECVYITKQSFLQMVRRGLTPDVELMGRARSERKSSGNTAWSAKKVWEHDMRGWLSVCPSLFGKSVKSTGYKGKRRYVVCEKDSLSCYKLKLGRVTCLDRPCKLEFENPQMLAEEAAQMGWDPSKACGYTFIVSFVKDSSNIHIMLDNKHELARWVNQLQSIITDVAIDPSRVSSAAQFQVSASTMVAADGENSSYSDLDEEDVRECRSPPLQAGRGGWAAASGKWGQVLCEGWARVRAHTKRRWRKSYIIVTPHCIVVFKRILAMTFPLFGAELMRSPKGPLLSFSLSSPGCGVFCAHAESERDLVMWQEGLEEVLQSLRDARKQRIERHMRNHPIVDVPEVEVEARLLKGLSKLLLGENHSTSKVREPIMAQVLRSHFQQNGGRGDEEKTSFTVLSIDGIGFSAVSSCVALRRLVDMDAVSIRDVRLWLGSGVGAVVAALLAAGAQPDALEGVLEALFHAMFERSELGEVSSSLPRYEAARTEHFLRLMWGPMRLRDLPTAIIVPIFQIAPPPGMDHVRVIHSAASDVAEMEVCELLLRSLAIPLYFPARQGFVGGGFCCQNPSASALDYLYSFNPDLVHRISQLISLGIESKPVCTNTTILEHGYQWGAQQWSLALPEFQDAVVRQTGTQLCRRVLGERYRRVGATAEHEGPVDGTVNGHLFYLKTLKRFS